MPLARWDRKVSPALPAPQGLLDPPVLLVHQGPRGPQEQLE